MQEKERDRAEPQYVTRSIQITVGRSETAARPVIVPRWTLSVLTRGIVSRDVSQGGVVVTTVGRHNHRRRRASAISISHVHRARGFGATASVANSLARSHARSARLARVASQSVSQSVGQATKPVAGAPVNNRTRGSEHCRNGDAPRWSSDDGDDGDGDDDGGGRDVHGRRRRRAPTRIDRRHVEPLQGAAA